MPFIKQHDLDELRCDARRLDWLEAQGNGGLWIARQSFQGRGMRLHNTMRTAEEGARPTVRNAIDSAMSCALKEGVQ